MGVLVRVRPYTAKEKKRGAERWPRCVKLGRATQNGREILLGQEPEYSCLEPPSSIGRQLAARISSNYQESSPIEEEEGGTPEHWETLATPTPPRSPFTPVTNTVSDYASQDVTTTPQRKAKRFVFPSVFGPEIQTRELYESGGLGGIVDGFVNDGYNGTIMCYGQTGSGKTYTMDGVVDLAIDDIFSCIENAPEENRFLLRASVLEVYNEKVTDLLVSPGDRRNLRLLDVPLKKEANRSGNAELVVDGLTEKKIDSKETLRSVLQTAQLNRVTGNTKMNDQSSRSHLLVRMTLERTFPESGNTSRMLQVSCLNLVDLAGSERAKESQTAGMQLKESCAINQSLLCLGNVVSRLAEGDAAGHIPYRASKLTRLLQHALGGNSKTAMICTVSQAGGWHLEQTRSTLSFASRAMTITNQAQRNIEKEETLHASPSLLLRYEKEIEALSAHLEDMGRQDELNKEDNRESLEYIEKLKKQIRNLNRFILNDGRSRFDPESPKSADNWKSQSRNNQSSFFQNQRMYTTLGLVSPPVLSTADSGRINQEQNRSFLVSPLIEQLERYKDTRQRQQSELNSSFAEIKKCNETIVSLQENVASLKNARELDKIFMQNQVEEARKELDDYERENVKIQTECDEVKRKLKEKEGALEKFEVEAKNAEAGAKSKDALLEKQNEIINTMTAEISNLQPYQVKCEGQSKEIQNLKALNKRLCEEAQKYKEVNENDKKQFETKIAEKEQEIGKLIEANKDFEKLRLEADIEAQKAEESALELCSQISALEGTLDKVGTKAALVSPTVRRVKELEEKLTIKTAQLKNVEEKIDSIEMQSVAEEKSRISMRKRKFSARKLRAYALRLDTALIKMQDWTDIGFQGDALFSRPGKSHTSPNTPRLPPRSSDPACITWEHINNSNIKKKQESPHTPENMLLSSENNGAATVPASAVKRQELGQCVAEAISSCKLFKDEVELLYLSLYEAEEANDGQQVLLTVVAQEHAKKSAELEKEVARLLEAKVAFEFHAAKDKAEALGNMQQSMEAALADKVSKLEHSEHHLQLKSDQNDHLKEDLKEKIALLAQREARLLEFFKAQEENKEVIADLQEKLELRREEKDSLQLTSEAAQKEIEIEKANAEAKIAEAKASFQLQKQALEASFNERMQAAGMEMESKSRDELKKQESRMYKFFEDALSKQKKEMEAFNADEQASKISALSEELALNQKIALLTLQEELEKQSKMTLEDALEKKASEFDSAVMKLKEEHTKQVASLRDKHAEAMSNLETELEQSAIEAMTRAVESERSIAEAKVAEAKASFLVEAAKNRDSALAELKQTLEASFNERMQAAEREMEIKSKDALEQQEYQLKNYFQDELVGALSKQKEELEAFSAEQEAMRLSSLREELSANKNIALLTLQEELEEQSRIALEEALEMKTCEFDSVILTLNKEHNDQIASLREDLEQQSRMALEEALEIKKSEFDSAIEALEEKHAEAMSCLEREANQSSSEVKDAFEDVDLGAFVNGKSREKLAESHVASSGNAMARAIELERAKLAEAKVEREVLMRKLKSLPPNARESLFQAWGFRPGDRNRKWRLIQGLFRKQGKELLSEQVITRLLQE